MEKYKQLIKANIRNRFRDVLKNLYNMPRDVGEDLKVVGLTPNDARTIIAEAVKEVAEEIAQDGGLKMANVITVKVVDE